MRLAYRALLIVLTVSLTVFTPFVTALGQETGATADEADVEFRLGNEAYKDRDYRKALSHYFASNRLVPNRNVIFNIARCYENLDEFVEAWRYYRAYQKTTKEDDERKKVGDALARIGKRVGVLEITSKPSGAAIFLNRQDLGRYGTTPDEVPVRPGTYTVIVDKPGFHARTFEEVEVEAGQTIEKSVELERKLATVSLSGTPERMRVVIDGLEPVEVTLPAQVSVPTGAQNMVLRADGYVDQVVQIDLEEGATESVEVKLERQTGSLVVTATELDAAVYLDGEVIGFTPSVVDGVPVGKHEVVVRQEGFQAARFPVTIKAGTRTEVDAPLVATSEVAAASRVKESVRDAPASVSLISSREIEAFAYKGTADALAGTRGIYYTNDLTYRLVGLRGYGSFGLFGNRTLVQLDGHTVNDSWIEASFHEFELMTDIYGLDRIELVRGPNSVLYGSGAFQGVINLASPEIDDDFQSNRVGVGAIQNGAARAYAHVREAYDEGGIQLSAGLSRGQPRDFVSDARDGAVAENVGDFDEYTLRANAAWRDVKFYSYWHDRTQQSPFAQYETIYGEPGSFERDRRGYADLRWEPRWDSFELDTRVYYDAYYFDGEFIYEDDDGGIVDDSFAGHGVGGEVRSLFRPFDGARWTVGVEATRNFSQEAESADTEGVYFAASTPFWKASAHAIARQDLLEGVLGLWAGARYDVWSFDSLPTPTGTESRTISNVNPRAVVMLQPTESATSKLMVARGFRAPSVYELTYNDDGFTQIAAPQLEPETTYSVELEHTHELPMRFEAVGALFVNQTANRIEQTGGGASADPLQFQNIPGELFTAGAEAELRRPFFRGWMMTVNYGYQRTREGGFGDIFGPGSGIPNSPRHLAALKLAVPAVRRRLIVANRVRFESGRLTREGDRTRPAVLWDVVASGEIDVVPVRYAVRVENLLDWDYRHPVGDEFLDVTTPQPGRTFIADVAVEF